MDAKTLEYFNVPEYDGEVIPQSDITTYIFTYTTANGVDRRALLDNISHLVRFEHKERDSLGDMRWVPTTNCYREDMFSNLLIEFMMDRVVVTVHGKW